MRHQTDSEENFIERKRQWKSALDKPMGPSVLITILPPLLMCAFLVVAAPYLQQIVMRFIGEEKAEIRGVDTAEESAPAAKPEFPIDPDKAEALFYQNFYEEKGIDWRATPVLEIPKEEVVKPEVEIKPLDVELYVPLSDPER